MKKFLLLCVTAVVVFALNSCEMQKEKKNSHKNYKKTYHKVNRNKVW